MSDKNAIARAVSYIRGEGYRIRRKPFTQGMWAVKQLGFSKVMNETELLEFAGIEPDNRKAKS